MPHLTGPVAQIQLVIGKKNWYLSHLIDQVDDVLGTRTGGLAKENMKQELLPQ